MTKIKTEWISTEIKMFLNNDHWEKLKKLSTFDRIITIITKNINGIFQQD